MLANNIWTLQWCSKYFVCAGEYVLLPEADLLPESSDPPTSSPSDDPSWSGATNSSTGDLKPSVNGINNTQFEEAHSSVTRPVSNDDDISLVENIIGDLSHSELLDTVVALQDQSHNVSENLNEEEKETNPFLGGGSDSETLSVLDPVTDSSGTASSDLPTLLLSEFNEAIDLDELFGSRNIFNFQEENETQCFGHEVRIPLKTHARYLFHKKFSNL